MTPMFRRMVNPAASDARETASAISLLVFAAVLTAVLFIALRSPLKDDIAWLLYVARRWMTGHDLYIDVVEVNPPLIIWISAIPLEIARWLDISVQFVVMPVFIAAVLACAWWTASLLREQGGLLRDRLPVFAAIGSALLILPAADLGQREHLLVAAFLPFLVLFSRSLEGKRIPVLLAALAGVLAGLGCALKPHYCAVFAVLEVAALVCGTRPGWAIWRLKGRFLSIVAGVTLAGYAGLVAIVCPAYLHRAVPMALALYGATDVSFVRLLSDSSTLICGELAAIGLLWLRRRDLPNLHLILTLMLFAVTSTVICFVDGKNWYYHRLPATVATMLALLLWTATEVAQRRWRTRAPLLVSGLAILVFCAVSARQLEPEALDAVEPQQTAVDRLEQIIRAEHARTYIAFSEWIALGFPVVNETGVTWASRFDSMWALKGEVWRATFDPDAAREWPIARWVAHDFIAGCPDIAVVDMRESTKYIKVLSAADPAFTRAWSRYHPIASFDGLMIYKRNRAGCLDVWVATGSNPAADVR